MDEDKIIFTVDLKTDKTELKPIWRCDYCTQKEQFPNCMIDKCSYYWNIEHGNY